jgi:hypothetical protein
MFRFSIWKDVYDERFRSHAFKLLIPLMTIFMGRWLYLIGEVREGLRTSDVSCSDGAGQKLFAMSA